MSDDEAIAELHKRRDEFARKLAHRLNFWRERYEMCDFKSDEQELQFLDALCRVVAQR